VASMIKAGNFLTLILLICAAYVEAQQGVLENNSPALNWQQINTENFRLIFPKGFETQAQRMANTLETIHEPEKLGDKAPKKIPIIFRNQNAISNGFVTLAPRRSEFYTMPSQNNQFLGTNDWLDLLAIHEYRHIAQFQQSRSGFNKVFSYLFGQNTQSAMAFSAAPPWFWEGDATMIETVNSRSGRGRIPEFSRVFKTNLLEKKKYNYNKQHLRSFKDFIPDHYRLGYYFVSHLRRETGDPEIWDKISKSAWSWPFVPFTFSNSLNQHTDDFLVKSYNSMMRDVESEWKDQLQGLEPTEFNTLNNRKSKAFTEYKFPQVLPDGTVVAFKSGIGDVGQLVRFDANGKEIESFITGVMNSTGMLSSSEFKVVWNEYHFDPRWRAKTYSVIKTYDFYKGELETVTEKSRYAGAGLSPDGYQIVTTETTEDYKHSLIILDTYTGEEVHRFRNIDNVHYAMPRFSDDGSKIVAITTSDKGRAVISVDLQTNAVETLIGYSEENIGYPVMTDDYLFYNSPVNGIDNIYAMDLATGDHYQVTKSKYGAYNPQLFKSRLYYNEHTANGMDVVYTKINPDNWTPKSKIANRNIDYFKPIIEQEGHSDILSEVGNEEYEVSNYSVLGQAINFHSWGPFATTDINTAQVGLFSRDELSTTLFDIGYTYDVTEQTGFGSVGFSYQGLYPIIDVEATYGSRRVESGSLEYTWDETSYEVGLRIPWLLTNSKFQRELEIGNSVGVRQISSFENDADDFGRFRPSRVIGREIIDTDTVDVPLFLPDTDVLGNGDLLFNHVEATYYSLMKQSKRDINSRFGFLVGFDNFSTISGDFEGSITALRGLVFLPGLFKHHSLFFQAAHQSRSDFSDLNSYAFRNLIFRPRGYSYFTDETFTTLRTNYALPLLYPDIALGPILNIQRIKANLFFDYGQSTLRLPFYRQDNGDLFGFQNLDDQYVSFGAEITVDFNFMRFTPLLEMGARYVYSQGNDFEPAGSQIELIIGNISF